MEPLEEKGFSNTTYLCLTQSSLDLLPEQKGEGNENGEAFPLTWNCLLGICFLLLPSHHRWTPRTGEGDLIPLRFWIVTRNRAVQRSYNLVQAPETSL